MSRIRALDALIGVLCALNGAVLLTGGWIIPLGPWRLPITRPEDVLLATLPLLALRWWLRPPALPALNPRWALAIGVGAYTLLFSFITVSRHYTFKTHALDLGYYVQVLSNLARGQGAYVSLPEMHAWGDHFSPILYLFVPLFVVAPGAAGLLIAQSAGLALGAFAVFALARRRLGDERLAAGFAGLYLLNPTLHGINLRDFHPIALGSPLMLAAMAWFETGRPLWGLAAALLALSTREDAALGVIGLGLWLALRRRWRWGTGLLGLGIGWLALATGWLMPLFREAAYPHLHRWSHLGGSLTAIILFLLAHPLKTLSFTVSERKLVYLLALLAPLGFLSLLGPLDLIPGLPTLVMNLLSRDPVLFHHRTPYAAFILPAVVLAGISGYRRLEEWTRDQAGARRSRITPRTVLGLAVLLSLALTSRTLNELAVPKWRLDARHRAAHAVMTKIPAEGGVSTWERFVPHVALRRHVFIFPAGLEQSDYVLLNLDTLGGRGRPLARLERRGDGVVLRTLAGTEYRYAVVAEEAGYLLLGRAAAPAR